MRNNTVFSKALFFLSNILFPLTAGFTIYLLFQSNVPIVRASWFSVVRNYLPDALWAYALYFSLLFILGNSKPCRLLAFVICSIVSALTEIAQLFAIFPGTFDIMDILTEIISVTLAFYLSNNLKGFINENI